MFSLTLCLYFTLLCLFCKCKLLFKYIGKFCLVMLLYILNDTVVLKPEVKFFNGSKSSNGSYLPYFDIL